MDLVLNQNVTINNADLKKITTDIRKAGANVIGNTYKIASLIAKVDTDELYLEDGFVDVFDYCKQCFGLEKASCYNLIKVGKEFIECVESGNTTKFQTMLTHGSKDYSISQVFKMLPLGIDKAKELTADGVIDETMSCRAIEKIVKENTEGTKARGKSKTENPEPDDPILCGFRRIHLKAGEEASFSVPINPDAFTVVNEEGSRIPGSSKHTLYAGFGAPDARTAELSGQEVLKISLPF